MLNLRQQQREEKKNTNLFGLELLERLEENTIQHDYERNIVIFHWFLTSNGYGCIGKGDAKEISGDEITSELLPEGWNSNEEKDNVLLRYVKDKKLYLARIAKLTDDLIFNLIRAEDMKITSCIVPTSHVPDEYATKIEIIDRFEKNILDFEPAKDDGAKKTAPNQPSFSQSAINTRPILMGPDPSSLMFNVGRADLDPFAARYGMGGGGNLFPVNRPPTSRIRIDPVGPFHPGRHGFMGPDPDHLRRQNPDLVYDPFI